MSLVDAIPQTIKQIGQIRAGGAASRGAYGNALADIGKIAASIPAQMEQHQAREQQNQIRQQQLEMGGLELADKKRAAAANQALESAMSQALDANGNVDPQKLTAHLAGTPAASKIPDILEHFSKMQQSSVNLQIAKGNLDDSDRDEMGALAAAAEAAGQDPDTQAGVILTGIASRVKRGRMSQADATPIVANMMSEVDGEGPSQPDPEKVKAMIAQMKAGSKEQRTLADADTRAKYQAESAGALADSRKETERQKKLQNYAAQLGASTSAADYARRYAGMPPEFRSAFDPPESFDPKTSPQRARMVGMTPEQQSTMLDREADNAARDAAARETEQYHHDTIAARDRNTEMHANRPSGGAADQSGVYGTATERGYNSFLKNWTARYPKPADSAVDDDGNHLPAPPAPPSLEKWFVMTPAERQRVLVEPAARIDDAEMQRRSGGGDPGEKPSAAAPQSSARPGAGKTVSMAQVRAFAKAQGISEDQAREQAIHEGYAVGK